MQFIKIKDYCSRKFENVGFILKNLALGGLVSAVLFTTFGGFPLNILPSKAYAQENPDTWRNAIEELEKRIGIAGHDQPKELKEIVKQKDRSKLSELLKPPEFNLETAINKMPEVYTEEVSGSLVGEYKNLISKLPKDAQQWIAEMGQFLEDKKLSRSEKKLLELLVSREDPLIYLTSLRIIDGISGRDIRWVKKDPMKADGYMYLKDDVKELQEKGLLSEKAKHGLDRIVQLAEDDYEVRKGLYLINNFGHPNRRMFRYKVPDFNTQLFVLGKLLEKGILEGYERMALGAALDYGSVITIGDDEVDKKVVDYAYNMIKFIEETDKIIKEKGVPWQAKNYPLEAAIALAGGAMSNQHINFYRKRLQRSWEDVFSKKQMEKFEFDWMFISQDTIKEQRDYVLKQFYFVNSGYLIHSIDNFVIDHLDHYDLLKTIIVNGQKVRKKHLENPNYQWTLFKTKGRFYGDCLDWSGESSSLAKSVNVSTIKGRVIDIVDPDFTGHTFVMYYQPKEDVWRSVQIPVRSRDVGKVGQYGYIAMSFMNFLNKKAMNRFYTPGHRFLVSADVNVVKNIPLGYIFRRADRGFKYKIGPGNPK